MPRNYVRKTERGKWSAETLRRAIQEVRRGTSTREAAKRYGIPRQTLADRIKAENDDKPCLGPRPLFCQDFEEELAERIIMVADMFYGVTSDKLASLAFEFAERQNIPHRFNRVKKRAGPDWVAGFLRRNPQVSVRKPENCSLARLEAINKENLKKFYKNVADVTAKHGPFPPHRIFNVDETGITPVVNSPKVLAGKGRRNVGRVSSAERGKLVTVVGCVSADGNCVPPMLIFGGRKRMDPGLMKDAPLGSIGAVSENGWVNTSLFMQWFTHFVDYVGPSKERRVLLIMDNHSAHISGNLICQARLVGVDIVTLPPHSSHVLQPLDISVYGPLKRAWARQVTHQHDITPGRRIQDKDVAGLLARAWETTVANRESIRNGFKSSGIYPYNPDRVMESSITFAHNRVMCDDEEDEAEARDPAGSAAEARDPAGSAAEAGTPARNAAEAGAILGDVFPLPRVKRVKGGKRKRRESVFLTSSPVKKAVEEKENNSKKKAKSDKSSEDKKKKNKKETKTAHDNGAKDADTCMFCTEGVIGQREVWLCCIRCKKWAHEECSGGSKSSGFVCDFCRC